MPEKICLFQLIYFKQLSYLNEKKFKSLFQSFSWSKLLIKKEIDSSTVEGVISFVVGYDIVIGL